MIRALDAAPPPPGSTQGGVHWRMHIGASKTVAEPTHSTGRPTSRQRDENAVRNVPIDLLLVWHRDPAATASEYEVRRMRRKIAAGKVMLARQDEARQAKLAAYRQVQELLREARVHADADSAKS